MAAAASRLLVDIQNISTATVVESAWNGDGISGMSIQAKLPAFHGPTWPIRAHRTDSMLAGRRKLPHGSWKMEGF